MALNLIERNYQQRIDVLTPRERVARAVSFFQWTRDTIARQIRRDMGPISSERLKWLVALRQYGADSATREMIQKALENVPR